jgi:hypothetical protein
MGAANIAHKYGRTRHRSACAQKQRKYAPVLLGFSLRQIKAAIAAAPKLKWVEGEAFEWRVMTGEPGSGGL